MLESLIKILSDTNIKNPSHIAFKLLTDDKEHIEPILINQKNNNQYGGNKSKPKTVKYKYKTHEFILHYDKEIKPSSITIYRNNT